MLHPSQGAFLFLSFPRQSRGFCVCRPFRALAARRRAVLCPAGKSAAFPRLSSPCLNSPIRLPAIKRLFSFHPPCLPMPASLAACPSTRHFPAAPFLERPCLALRCRRLAVIPPFMRPTLGKTNASPACRARTAPTRRETKSARPAPNAYQGHGNALPRANALYSICKNSTFSPLGPSTLKKRTPFSQNGRKRIASSSRV